MFLTATDISGSSPHHINPAISLHRRGGVLRVVAPVSNAFDFNSDGVLSWVLPDHVYRFVPRTRKLISRISWHMRCLIESFRAIKDINANEFYVYGSQVSAVARVILLFIPRGIRVTYHTQDFLEPWVHPFRALFEALVARRADHVIVNEINRGRAMQSIYSLYEAPYVVPTGLARDWPAPKRNLDLRRKLLERNQPSSIEPAASIFVIHQGPLRHNRCGKELLSAFAKLPPDYNLVVTGSTLSDLADLAPPNSLDIIEKVITLQSMDFNEMLELTASCDIGVLLYPNDGIGNFYQCPGRLSENGMSKIPSIASSNPLFKEISASYGFLELCESTDPSDIANAIRRLGEKGTEGRRVLGAQAYDYSHEKLDFKNNMEKVFKVIYDE